MFEETISDLFHRAILFAAIVTIISAVWVSAWERALESEANRLYWPALPLPAQHVNGAAGVALSK